MAIPTTQDSLLGARLGEREEPRVLALGSRARRRHPHGLVSTEVVAQSSHPVSLELTILVARKDPRRHQRVAARWLLRYLEEHPSATIEEAALAASSLIALTGTTHQEAAQILRAMAERATSRRRGAGRGVSRGRVVWAASEAPVVFGSPPAPGFLENPSLPDSPMKKPGELHIINGPVFSSYTNRWGADCSCGWKTSHDFHRFVDWAVTQHRRVAAGFRIKKRRERVRDEKTATSSLKTCPACAEKVTAPSLWCRFCGFRFDSVEAAEDI